MKTTKQESVIVARAFAKINLGLEVLAKRDDGYHELRTILQTVDFCDVLTFELGGDAISLSTSDPVLGTGPENLVIRAATALAAGAAGLRASIHLEKKIPAGMGLGGGSADAAMTLLALDRLWNLQTPLPELHRLAASIGTDVPFFLYGGGRRSRR
jgi:4-diphosphocytidyl-2-C-methyl-D-erythritol kinase